MAGGPIYLKNWNNKSWNFDFLNCPSHSNFSEKKIDVEDKKSLRLKTVGLYKWCHLMDGLMRGLK